MGSPRGEPPGQVFGSLPASQQESTQQRTQSDSHTYNSRGLGIWRGVWNRGHGQERISD